jgi:hypothetical protein
LTAVQYTGGIISVSKLKGSNLAFAGTDPITEDAKEMILAKLAV